MRIDTAIDVTACEVRAARRKMAASTSPRGPGKTFERAWSPITQSIAHGLNP